MEELEDHVASLAEPVLVRHGAELVEVQVKRGRTQLVRVIADKPGGIDLETCAIVSKELSRMLDVEDPIEGRYTLEVTSPGLDRPLRTPEDFRRNVGRKVKIVMETAQEEGVIEEVREDGVLLAVGAGSVEIPLADVKRATVVLPW